MHYTLKFGGGLTEYTAIMTHPQLTGLSLTIMLFTACYLLIDHQKREAVFQLHFRSLIPRLLIFWNLAMFFSFLWATITTYDLQYRWLLSTDRTWICDIFLTLSQSLRFYYTCMFSLFLRQLFHPFRPAQVQIMSTRLGRLFHTTAIFFPVAHIVILPVIFSLSQRNPEYKAALGLTVESITVAEETVKLVMFVYGFTLISKIRRCRNEMLNVQARSVVDKILTVSICFLVSHLFTSTCHVLSYLLKWGHADRTVTLVFFNMYCWGTFPTFTISAIFPLMSGQFAQHGRLLSSAPSQANSVQWGSSGGGGGPTCGSTSAALGPITSQSFVFTNGGGFASTAAFNGNSNGGS